MNIEAIFNKHSGNEMVNAARKMAEAALNNNPATDERGNILASEDGRGYMDPNKARAALSEQHGRLMESVTKSLNGHMTDSAIADTRKKLDIMRTLEVAQACVDIYAAPDDAPSGGYAQRLANAVAGLNPTNATQAAASKAIGKTLDSLGTQSDKPPSNKGFTVQIGQF